MRRGRANVHHARSVALAYAAAAGGHSSRRGRGRRCNICPSAQVEENFIMRVTLLRLCVILIQLSLWRFAQPSGRRLDLQ